jgi:hypothetical protein
MKICVHNDGLGRCAVSGEHCTDGPCDCEDLVEYEPVRHGRWITQWCDNNMIGHEYAECSVCGCSMLDTNQFWNSKYCPHCGAKMDGDSHE